VFSWPCGITVDRHAGKITFCYLLFKRTIALERLERCAVTEVLNRAHYATYLLHTKAGKVITLSDLTISHFPGTFPNNIAMEIDDRFPRFIPGFRWLFHKR
jgi:hypothetical protein